MLAKTRQRRWLSRLWLRPWLSTCVLSFDNARDHGIKRHRDQILSARIPRRNPRQDFLMRESPHKDGPSHVSTRTFCGKVRWTFPTRLGPFHCEPSIRSVRRKVTVQGRASSGFRAKMRQPVLRFMLAPLGIRDHSRPVCRRESLQARLK